MSLDAVKNCLVTYDLPCVYCTVRRVNADILAAFRIRSKGEESVKQALLSME